MKSFADNKKNPISLNRNRVFETLYHNYLKAMIYDEFSE